MEQEGAWLEPEPLRPSDHHHLQLDETSAEALCKAETESGGDSDLSAFNTEHSPACPPHQELGAIDISVHSTSNDRRDSSPEFLGVGPHVTHSTEAYNLKDHDHLRSRKAPDPCSATSPRNDGSVAMPVEASDPEPRTESVLKRIAMTLIPIIVLLLLFWVGIRIAGGVMGLKNRFQEIPWWITAAIYIPINFIRKTVPPIYVLFPVMGVVMLMFAEAVGPAWGTMILCILNIQDALHFCLFRRYYGKIADSVFEQNSGHRWVPTDIQRSARVVDGGWRQYASVASPLRKVHLVWAFTCSYWTDDFLQTFWLATRSNIEFKYYLIGYLPGLASEFPKIYILQKVLLSTTNSIAFGGDFGGLFIDDFPVVIAVLVLCLNAPATLFFHGSNVIWGVRALLQCCGCLSTDRGPESQSSQEAMNTDNGLTNSRGGSAVGSRGGSAVDG